MPITVITLIVDETSAKATVDDCCSSSKDYFTHFIIMIRNG